MSARVAPAVPESALAIAAHARRQAQEDRGLLLSDLERLVDHDSPSGDRAACDTLAALLRERLAAYGVAAELRPTAAGDQLRARLHGRGRSRVALLCHHDTVYPQGSAAARPFAVRGERAFGPGVADMKGGIVVAVHALRLLADEPDLGLVELISLPDEEIRSEPFPGRDELAHFDAALCLECGRPGGGIVSARKGAHWFAVCARGRSAHPGVDAGSGRNALVALCVEALRIARLDGARDGLGVNPTTLHAGEGVNSIPARAELTVDLRAWHESELDWALAEAARFGSHDGVELALRRDNHVPPLERTAAVAALAAAATSVGAHLGTPVVEVATGGVSDGCWTAEAGIPSLDGLGPVGSHDHGPDEQIEVASLADRVGLLAGLVAAVAARDGS